MSSAVGRGSSRPPAAVKSQLPQTQFAGAACEDASVKPMTAELAAGWGETSVSTLEPQLLYRGYPADELSHRSNFLETAYLLIHGDLPTDEQLADWQALLYDALTLPSGVVTWLRRVPGDATTTDVLLAALAREPLRDAHGVFDPAINLGDRFPAWLGRLTALTAARRQLLVGREPIQPDGEMSFAANLWQMLHGDEPPAWLERTLDALLILCAEHGFAPSTIAVRMAAASEAEFSSALLAGLSVARGSRSAGSAAEALAVYAAVRTSDRAADWVRTMLERGQRLAGFQHRAYRVGDPRAESLSVLCRQVAERTGRGDREQFASAIEQAVWDQAQLLPALSWPASRLLDGLGIEPDLFVPLFALSRLAGWTAHFSEQFRQQPAVLVRPKYAGPALRHHRPLNERGGG